MISEFKQRYANLIWNQTDYTGCWTQERCIVSKKMRGF
jgi:hypothetical protein